MRSRAKRGRERRASSHKTSYTNEIWIGFLRNKSDIWVDGFGEWVLDQTQGVRDWPNAFTRIGKGGIATVEKSLRFRSSQEMEDWKSISKEPHTSPRLWSLINLAREALSSWWVNLQTECLLKLSYLSKTPRLLFQGSSKPTSGTWTMSCVIPDQFSGNSLIGLETWRKDWQSALFWHSDKGQEGLESLPWPPLSC